MFGDNFFHMAITRLPVIILALTVHEYFHAWTALKFGDTTARDMGRLTLYPPAHLDLMGSLVMIISGFQFGWAKPVPVNPFNLRNMRSGFFWVSFAGPLSNIGQAIIFALLFRTLHTMVSPVIVEVFTAGVLINLVLAFFNLLPLFPLDGSNMLRTKIPDKYDDMMAQLDRIAPFILIMLVVTGLLWKVIGPPVILIYSFLLG